MWMISSKKKFKKRSWFILVSGCSNGGGGGDDDATELICWASVKSFCSLNIEVLTWCFSATGAAASESEARLSGIGSIRKLSIITVTGKMSLGRLADPCMAEMHPLLA